MLQQHGELEKRVQDNVTQIWENQAELKRGMDAAEFNLRSHQKVLNALAIEFERLVTHLNNEVFKTEHDMLVLELADVTLPAIDGEVPQVVRRLDWPYYHGQVEKDLHVLQEAEAWKASEEEKRKRDTAFVSDDFVEEQLEQSPQDGFPEGASIFGE